MHHSGLKISPPVPATTSRGSVQLGLSVAGGALGLFQLGRATDKRYSLSSSMVDCCAPIQVPGAGLRLEERSDERYCGSDKFKLHACPSCGALWVAHDAFWDHGTWYRKEYIRVENAEGFDALLASKRAEKAAAKPVAPKPVPSTLSDISRAFQIAVAFDREKGHNQSEQGST